MSISLMKIIDEYLGKVVIFFISILKKLSPKITPVQNTYKNILLIKFWGIGSIVLTTPALSKVRAAYPDSQICFLTLQSNLEMCKEIKLIDKIQTINISTPAAFILSFVKAILILRKINFDLIYDFEFYTNFSAIIVSLLKSNESAGFDNSKNNRNILFSKTILFNTSIHTRDNFINLVNAEDRVNSVSDAVSFPAFGKSERNGNGEIQIIVNPNASKLAYERRLPKEYFIEIINHITKHFKFKIIITGSEDEINYVQNIYEHLADKSFVNNLCGKTNIKELISLIQHSSCLITNDSGPLHIASALNKPSIAFFGPESPLRYGPLSKSSLVFYKNLPCSPCMSINNSKTVNCIFPSPKCMEEFQINDVIKRIDAFLNENILPKNTHITEWSESI